MIGNPKRRYVWLLFLLITAMITTTWQVQAAGSELFILKGDLHCHSTFSDGLASAEQVVRESKRAGYDFIALTDHNTYRHMEKDWSTPDLLVISSYELTTDKGHFNIFGLRKFMRKFEFNTKAELNEFLLSLRKQGAIIQVNHPNSDLYYSRFGYDLGLDSVELVNGSFDRFDLKTLQDYQQLLCEGRKLIATGGTDAHKNYLDRRTFNCLLVREKSEAAIWEALRAGRNYVTVSADGPVISLQCGDTLMGGTVAYQAGQTVRIAIANLVPGTIIKIYTSKGLELTEKYAAASKGTYTKEIATKDIKFCRVELWFDDSQICAYSNPIYIQQ